MAGPFWSLSEINGFILDWDGILANTKLDFRPIRNKYFGGKIVPLIERAKELPHPLNEEVCEAIVKVEMNGADHATPVDGALELIEWLNVNEKPWAVVSRNCRDSIVLAAQRCGIALPDVVMCREDEITKPDPRALVIAAERIHVSPSECVMLGDFVYDVLGARRVPMRCVLISGESTIKDWGHLADLACPSMKDFLKELREPRTLVPWEYRSLVCEHGTDYFAQVNRVRWRVKNLREALDAARAGVIRLVIPKEARLTLEQWQTFDIDPKFIDQLLFDVVSDILPRRWPAVTISREVDTMAESAKSKEMTLLFSEIFNGETVQKNVQAALLEFVSRLNGE